MIDERLIQIIKRNGFKRQIDKAVEEMAELQKALMKHKYCETDTEEVLGELADCFIMLKQVQYLLCISDEKLKQRMEYKINRTLERYDIEY